MALVIIPIISYINVRIASFQVPSISHLIKIPISLYHKEILICYPLFGHTLGEFSKNFRRSQGNRCLTFVASLKTDLVLLSI